MPRVNAILDFLMIHPYAGRGMYVEISLVYHKYEIVPAGDNAIYQECLSTPASGYRDKGQVIFVSRP